MRILINALSAKMGGATTYIRELATEVSARGIAHDFVFLVPPEHVASVSELAPAARVISSHYSHATKAKRLWFDQVGLRRLLRDERIDILFSTANFGLIASPCYQLLLVCNTIYFSPLYRQRYLHSFRQRLVHMLQRWLIWISVHSCDVLLTPSRTMLAELQQWMRIRATKAVAVIPYGVRHVSQPQAESSIAKESCTILFTSLYADHKNLGTLLTALRFLVKQDRDAHLLTTADPYWPAARCTHDWQRDARLARSPEILNRVHFVLKSAGQRPDELYRQAHIFVYPSVVESFGHPLVEAMASGLPIVAADVPINREICGDAALFFQPFSPEDLGHTISQLMDEPSLAAEMSRRSLVRSQDFCWEKHLTTLLGLTRASEVTTDSTPVGMPVKVNPCP